jgi:hypothetical protein
MANHEISEALRKHRCRILLMRLVSSTFRVLWGDYREVVAALVDSDLTTAEKEELQHLEASLEAEILKTLNWSSVLSRPPSIWR